MQVNGHDDNEIITPRRRAVAAVFIAGGLVWGLIFYGIISLAWRVFG
jgi:hypothetical protein